MREVTRNIIPDEENPSSLDAFFPGEVKVAAGYHDQFFVTEEAGYLTRILEGPFRTHQEATSALQSRQLRALRPAS